MASERGLALFGSAQRYIAGGVNAALRLNPVLGRPFFASRAQGGRVCDQDGREYIDLNMAHGAALLGHGHPAVRAAVEDALNLGVLCSFETEHQIEVAKRITELVPCAELVRFATSGTETTWHALRTARAFTGRQKVVKFEGHFHGFNDIVGFSSNPPVGQAGPAESPLPYPESAGMDRNAIQSVIVLPWNDVTAFERVIDTEGESIGAVIMEPINYDCFTIRPDVTYLRRVRDLTRERGIVLIFDEILSGFRTGPGCAQQYLDVIPDLCTLGKSLGGGFPLSAIAGRRDIMEAIAPIGRVMHSGTYNAHLVSILASRAFLREIAQPEFWANLEELEAFFYSGLQEIMNRAGLPIRVQAVGARFSLLFGLSEEPRNYRDTLNADKGLALQFYRAALEQGVYFHPGPHHGFSAMHTRVDLADTLQRIDTAALHLGPTASPIR